jgi:hypothetical protein
MIGFIGTSLTISLNHTYYNTITNLHTFQFTVAHTLSCLLATDLNKETSTSNNYEVFLPFLVQSPWNLGTQLKTILDPAPWRLHGFSAMTDPQLPWTELSSAFTSLISTLTYIDTERTWTYSKHISHDRYPASLLACQSDLQKTQLPILLHVGLYLQSCCLATHWSNPLHCSLLKAAHPE